MGISSEYMTYEGSLTWPGCFESVTWIIFNEYQQILSTYLQTLFPNILRFSNNRQMLNVGSSAQRNVRTNIGSQQWFRSSSSATCYPINHILEYHGKNKGKNFSSNLFFVFSESRIRSRKNIIP